MAVSRFSRLGLVAVAFGAAAASGWALAAPHPAPAKAAPQSAYHFVSITQDGRGCVVRLEQTSDGTGAAPKVVRTTSGNCDKPGAGAGVAPRGATPAPVPPATPVEPLPADAT